MDTHPRYTLVGVLITLILILLILWVTWLWKAGEKDKTTLYQINFRNQSLAGLLVDGIVTMRGLRVGTVKEIAIDPQDIESFVVKVALNNDTPIKTDTRAVVSRNLLTGLASIDLEGTSQLAKALLSEHQGLGLPIIQEGQGNLERIYQSAPDLMAKAENSLERIDRLLSDQNINAFSATLSNVENASKSLQKVSPLLDNAQQSFKELGSVLKEIKLNIAPVLSELELILKETRGAVKSLSSDYSSLAKSLAVASQSLKEPRSSILGLPSGQLGPGESEKEGK